MARQQQQLSSRLHLSVVGVASSFEMALRFCDWCRELQDDPTVQQIVQRWEVSRSTAYRWQAAWLAAKGRA